ncbi:MAG: RNA polymerase sigma factor [Planctomycetes bacterium]|nr:RNA polymerase sigma factor [Planctomycetota bacterium]
MAWGPTLDANLERDLVTRARSGSAPDREAAFAEVFQGLREPVLALCLNVTGERGEAEDALQETFLAVARGLPAFRGDARLTTWVYRIAIRAALRVRSRRRRTTFAPLEWDPPAPCAPDPLLGEELRARVAEAMGRLPAEHRVVLSLAALEGLPHADIAEVLGVPVGTVWSRLHAARTRLAAALGPYLG